MQSESPQNQSPFKLYDEIGIEDQSDCYQMQIMPSLLSHSSDFSEPPILSYSYSGISNASSNLQLNLYSSHKFEEPICHFSFRKAEKMFGSIEKMVGEVKETLLFGEDIILWLLYLHKWNKDRLYQQFYSRSQLYAQKNMAVQNKKPNNQNFISNGYCEVCSEQKLLLKNFTCCHSYCMDCWKSYIHEKLNENIIFFSCMNKCFDSPILLSFVSEHFTQLFDFYRKMICINFAALNKSISYCPSKKLQCDYFCQKNQFALVSGNNNVECLCGELYCFICKEQPHFPAHCDTVKTWTKLLNSEEGNSKWIQKNTRTCPSCKSSVEKYIGCSKVKCICSAQFCYECNSKWDEMHKSHKGECTEMRRKQSLEGRVETNDLLKTLQFSLMISRTQKKHSNTIKTVFKYLKQEGMVSKFHDIRKQVSDAWYSLKWGCISDFIYKKQEIEGFLQEQFIQSITKLMQSIQKIQQSTSFLSSKELQAIGDEVMNRRDILKKNKQVWIQAWRS